jgi:hypothetical protein
MLFVLKNVLCLPNQNGKTTPNPQINPIMKAIKLTSEQMKNDSGREYNPQIWNQKIAQLMTFSNVEFFKVERDDVYQYDRYFAKYQLADGMIFFNDFDYSSMISNGGFQQILISTFDIQKMELMPENTVEIFGNGRWIDNSKTSLNHMKKMSIQYETIWSKSGI